MNEVLVALPTINEEGTIGNLILELLNYPEIDILIIDDGSTDATESVVVEIANSNSRVKFVGRDKKYGVGNAHKFALATAKTRGYQYLVTMDADGSHDPSFLHLFFKKCNEADVIVGSRYLARDSMSDWRLHRKILTRLVHILVYFTLGLKEDSSSGFRMYTMDRISDDLLSSIQSESYDFFFESMWLFKSLYFKVVEVPILLPKRTYGNSKMELKDIKQSFSSLVRVFIIRKNRRFSKND